nr:low specificity L-threonine aldolase [Actinomycetales bacterium]
MTIRAELRSDNAAAIAPEILEAIARANSGSSPGYGGDETTARLNSLVSEVFEHEAQVFPVTTGTAANALALSAMAPPWGAVLCHEEAHILANEAAATSMFGGGLALHGLPGVGAKVSPVVVEETLRETPWGDPHNSQPAVLSVTNASEYGAVYTQGEVGELAATARRFGVTTHLDGARLANALAATTSTPADMTCRAGVSVLSLGATKNGAMSTDAIVSFDPEVSAQLVYRTKRAGHAASKMRFHSAQLVRYLEDGLWLRLAAHANAQMARLWAGLQEFGLPAVVQPQANLVFVDLPDGCADSLEQAGVAFYRMRGRQVRFVTSFATTDAELDHALTVIRGHVARDRALG